MMKWGSSSPKRTAIWSSDADVAYQLVRASYSTLSTSEKVAKNQCNPVDLPIVKLISTSMIGSLLCDFDGISGPWYFDRG